MGNDQEQARAFLETVRCNPASRSLFVSALNYAQEPRDRAELAQVLDELPKPSACLQSSQAIVATLVRAGVLSEVVLVNGVPYEGDAAHLADDETVPEDAVVAYRNETTAAGRLALRALEPVSCLEALFARRPEYREVFQAVLKRCHEADGCSGREIDAFLRGNEAALRRDKRTGLPTVYPAFYTGALEEVGALVWDTASRVWRVSESARPYMAAC